MPYVKIKPGVRKALKKTGRQWEEVYVGESDDDYFNLLNELWRERETFTIVEHDVIVRPDTFDELENCDRKWCSFPVPYLAFEYPGMACVKFHSEIIGANPDAFQYIGSRASGVHPPKHWCTLDHWLRTYIGEREHRQCVHGPALGHYRPYKEIPQPSHGCTGSRMEAK